MVEFILRYPRWIASINVVSCLMLGFFLESEFGNDFIERLGTFGAGISVFVFGIAVADLINRGQSIDFSRIPHIDDREAQTRRTQLGGLRSWENVSRVLNAQAFALLIGTIQSSFGSLAKGLY